MINFNNFSSSTKEDEIQIIAYKDVITYLNSGYTLFYYLKNNKYFIQKNLDKIHIYSSDSSHIFLKENEFISLYLNGDNNINYYLLNEDDNNQIDILKDNEFYRWKQ